MSTCNTIYPGTFAHVTSQGLLRNYAAGDTFTAGQLYTVAHSLEIFDIWEQEFGGPALQDRVVRVLAGAPGRYNAELIQQGLGDSQINPQNIRADAIALAPYFAGEVFLHLDPNQYCSYTEAQIMDSVRAAFQQVMTDPFEGMVPWREVTDSLHLPLLTYESGQHLTTGFWGEPDSCIDATLANVNRSADMAALYADYADYANYMRDTFQVSVDAAFVLWAGEYYREYFGLLENMYQVENTAPKWVAYQQNWLPGSDCGLTVGIEDQTKNTAPEFRLFPNPSQGDWVEISPADRIECVEIFDLQGRLLARRAVQNNRLSLAGLSRGQLYLLRLYANGTPQGTLRLLRP